MIEMLEGFPANVIAVAAKGRVTGQDYDTVLTPEVKQILATHHMLRCYYEIGPAFAGMTPRAFLEDMRLGLKYRSRWERVAVVTDIGWVRTTVNAFRFLIPGEIRTFSLAEAGLARNWVTAA